MAGGSEEAATGAGCSLSEGSAERLLPKTLEKKLPLSGSVSAGAAWAEALVSEAVGVEVTLTTRTLSAGGWRTGAGSGSGSAVKLGSRLSLGSSFLGRMFSGWSAGSLLRGAGSGGVRSLMSGSGDSFGAPGQFLQEVRWCRSYWAPSQRQPVRAQRWSLLWRVVVLVNWFAGVWSR